MLVTLNEILAMAGSRTCAIGAFNTPNLECITAVLRAAETLQTPVIISHAELHESVAPLQIIGPVMIQAAKMAKIPVCVHLDPDRYGQIFSLCSALDHHLFLVLLVMPIIGVEKFAQ